MNNPAFWRSFDDFVTKNGYEVDRPKGSTHPRYPEYIYPIDYGFIKNTKGGDGAEVDTWIGTLSHNSVTGLLVTVDALKNDTEIKILIGCSQDEMKAALSASNDGDMSAILIERS